MKINVNRVQNQRRAVIRTIQKYLPIPLISALDDRGFIEEVTIKIEDDLVAFASRDPAAKNCPDYIWYSYMSFQAVSHYRIANALYYTPPVTDEITPLQIIARYISEIAKVKTGIEIHPAAKIGRRFVIDHGVGTVIGETTEIGDDCYILQGVVIGSRGIADNPKGKRQPTIGFNVEIGGEVSILGPVRIGNHVKISPHAVILEDIPDYSRVLVLSTNQIIKPPKEKEVRRAEIIAVS